MPRSARRPGRGRRIMAATAGAIIVFALARVRLRSDGTAIWRRRGRQRARSLPGLNKATSVYHADMIDIQLLRREAAEVARRLQSRGFVFDLAGFEQLESRRKAVQSRAEELQARRNALSKQIGQAKARKENADALAGGGRRPRASRSSRHRRSSRPSRSNWRTCCCRCRTCRTNRCRSAGPRPTTSRCGAGERRPSTRSRSKDHVELGAGAGHGLRGGSQAFRRAIRRPEGRHRAAASRARAVHAGHPHRAARLPGVLHAIPGRAGQPARHRPAAQVRGRPLQGADRAAREQRRRAAATAAIST